MPRLRLICLPPAGAGPSLYRNWRDNPAGLEIAALPLPGRESRFREPVPGSLAALADQLAEEVAPRLPQRHAWFGYSMGGVLAHLLAERMAARGLPGPEALFILASNPPHRMLDLEEAIHGLDRAAFWAEIARIGGTPREILDNPEFRALFEPVLRHDFRLCETYAHRDSGFRLTCPLHVFVAADDHLVTAETAAGWADYSSGPVQFYRLEGQHMLNRASFDALPARIARLLERQAAGATV